MPTYYLECEDCQKEVDVEAMDETLQEVFILEARVCCYDCGVKRGYEN